VKAHAGEVTAAIVFLRWLAVGHVAITVSGVPVVVPALAVAAVAVMAVAAAVVALAVYRLRADRAARAAWWAAKGGAW
jgi:uncharacterized membrane protein YccF (DUF307 family)